MRKTAQNSIRVGIVMLLWSLGVSVVVVNLLFDRLQTPDGAFRLPAKSAQDGESSTLSGVSQQRQQYMIEEKRVWAHVFETVPDYTYAAIKLAHLSYQTGDISNARTYLLIAREQAPWDRTTASLSGALK